MFFIIQDETQNIQVCQQISQKDCCGEGDSEIFTDTPVWMLFIQQIRFNLDRVSQGFE
jgi:hypothetical protein